MLQHAAADLVLVDLGHFAAPVAVEAGEVGVVGERQVDERGVAVKQRDVLFAVVLHDDLRGEDVGGLVRRGDQGDRDGVQRVLQLERRFRALVVELADRLLRDAEFEVVRAVFLDDVDGGFHDFGGQTRPRRDGALRAAAATEAAAEAAAEAALTGTALSGTPLPHGGLGGLFRRAEDALTELGADVAGEVPGQAVGFKRACRAAERLLLGRRAVVFDLEVHEVCVIVVHIGSLCGHETQPRNAVEVDGEFFSLVAAFHFLGFPQQLHVAAGGVVPLEIDAALPIRVIVDADRAGRAHGFAVELQDELAFGVEADGVRAVADAADADGTALDGGVVAALVEITELQVRSRKSQLVRGPFRGAERTDGERGTEKRGNEAFQTCHDRVPYFFWWCTPRVQFAAQFIQTIFGRNISRATKKTSGGHGVSYRKEKKNTACNVKLTQYALQSSEIQLY